MNEKSTYNQNFDKSILKAMNCSIKDVDSFQFKLIPIEEGIGQESSKDIWMKNTKLRNNRIEELKSYKDAIWLLSAGDSKYPLWINMTKLNETVIQLEFSQRFRHIKTSQNQDTGHPPFKVIYKIDNLVEKTNKQKERLTEEGRIKELNESNINNVELPNEYVLYFLVDWSGPERIARFKIFNTIEEINSHMPFYFVDGTNQNLNFIKLVSDKIGDNLNWMYVGGHGTICYIREKRIIDEIKFPHTIDEEKIRIKIKKWIDSISKN